MTRIPLSRSKGHVSTCRGRGIVAGTQQTSIVVLLTLSTWTTDWQSAFCTALVRHVVSLLWLDADTHCICSLYLTSTVRRIHRWSCIFRSCIFWSCIFSAPVGSSATAGTSLTQRRKRITIGAKAKHSRPIKSSPKTSHGHSEYLN